MSTTALPTDTFTITDTILVRASIEKSFASLLVQMGRQNSTGSSAFTHTLFGPLPDGYLTNLGIGWSALHTRVREAAEEDGGDLLAEENATGAGQRGPATWRLFANGQELLAMPRMAFVRSVALSHWYHHRGQMLVDLRLLDLSVPSVYGPTADENPFTSPA